MMKYKTKGKFKLRLFFSVGSLFICLALMVSLLFSTTAIRNAKSTEISSSQIVLDRVSAQVDSLYEQMNIAATSITKNDSLKQIISSLNASGSEPTSREYMEQLSQERIIQKTLINMMFSPIISNVMLYNRECGYFYYTGIYLSDRDQIAQTLKENRAIELLTEADASTLYYGPHLNDWNSSDRTVLSVCKNFSDNTITRDTMVEIQVPYGVLADICTQNTFSNEKEILILDSDYNIVYPFEQDGYVISEEQLDSVLKNIQGGNTEHFSNSYSYNSSTSSLTSFTTVLISNNKTMQSQNISYIVTTVFTVLLVLLAALMIMFIILSIVTKPLKQLINHIDNLQLDQDTCLDLPEDIFDEFEIINTSFNHMLIRLEQSIAQNYELQIRESNANLTALQAQINPHFLYNALNAISAASEVYGSEVTTRMCQGFSSMMRYITSKEQIVPLIEEINHTKNYLEFMKISNDGNSSYELDIDSSLYDLRIPKLTIQPFVENCFKHAFECSPPPWKISLQFYISQNQWIIMVEDDGQGFPDDVLKELQTFKETTLKNRNFSYKDIEIDGLGLFNTFARLYAHFSCKFDFTVQNLSPGSRITMKGVLPDD